MTYELRNRAMPVAVIQLSGLSSQHKKDHGCLAML